jgi:hypothetical protein
MYEFAYLHPMEVGGFGNKNLMKHCFRQVRFRTIIYDTSKRETLLERFETNALDVEGVKHEKRKQ